MKLALRRTAAENATWVQRQFAALTRWRLCSVYCHAGIVIGERMLVIVKGWAGDLSGMTSEIVL